MNATWQVSAWNNGKRFPTGRGYGLRLGVNRQAVRHAAKQVTLQLGDGVPFEVRVTDGFWRHCPELRHAEIGQWFLSLGLLRWPIGKPHRFTMTPVGQDYFRVTYP